MYFIFKYNRFLINLSVHPVAQFVININKVLADLKTGGSQSFNKMLLVAV